MADDKELETWAKRLQILSSILGGGGAIGFLIAFSTLTFCKRIFLALILVTGTLALFIFSRLLIKAKNRPVIELPNQPAPSSFKYLTEYARPLLISGLILALVCISGVALFMFPEITNAMPVCATSTPTPLPTSTPTPALTPTPTLMPSPTPACITVVLNLNVVNTNVEVRVNESLVFEGTTTDGRIEVCLPNFYNNKEIELTVTAVGYNQSTTRFKAIPDLPPQSVDLQPIPTPEPCSITNLGWVEYQNDGLGSTISASPVIGSKCVLEISFDLKRNGWAAIYKKLQSNSLLHTQGLKFSYSGTGAANTLEFKLFEKDADGVETLFYAEWDGATSTAGETISPEIYYTDLICKPNASRCLTGAEPIDLKLVDRIDLSISNKPGQLPGAGKVTIESIQYIP